jgi:hypothetical protein
MNEQSPRRHGGASDGMNQCPGNLVLCGSTVQRRKSGLRVVRGPFFLLERPRGIQILLANEPLNVVARIDCCAVVCIPGGLKCGADCCGGGGKIAQEVPMAALLPVRRLFRRREKQFLDQRELHGEKKASVKKEIVLESSLRIPGELSLSESQVAESLDRNFPLNEGAQC